MELCTVVLGNDRNSAMNDLEGLSTALKEVESRGSDLKVPIQVLVSNQRVFDAIPSLFLSPNGVYVLVFDMESMTSSDEGERRKCLQELRSWVNTLIFHTSTQVGKELRCASIAIVGTRKEKVFDPNDHTKISTTIDRLGYNMPRKSLLQNRDESLCFFPINCTMGQKDVGVVNLMKAIEEHFLRADYVDTERPLAYMEVLDVLNEKKKDLSFLPLEEIFAIAIEHDIISPDLQEEMLRLFRDLGFILWYEEPPLRDIVILDPVQFFVRPVANIIFPGRMENDVRKVARKERRRDFEKMTKGIISSSLLEFILMKRLEISEGKLDKQPQVRLGILRELMVRFSLVVPFRETVSDTYFMVPALLPEAPALNLNDQASIENSVYFFVTRQSFDFWISAEKMESEGFLFNGIYHLFITGLMSRIKVPVDCIKFRDQIEFHIGDDLFTFTEVPQLNSVRIICRGGGFYDLLILFEREMIDALKRVDRNQMFKLKLFTLVRSPANSVNYFLRVDKIETARGYDTCRRFFITQSGG